MSRRIEIELTSSRADGSWTWRAAGAKQPRGVVEQNLLPGGVKVGDVLRVETEIGLDGIEISSVLPAKAPHKEPDRLELVSARPEKFEGVITTLVPKSDKRGRERRRGPGDEGGTAGRGARRPERRPAQDGARTERPRRTELPGGEGRPTTRPITRPTSRPAVATQEAARRPAKTTRPRPARLVPKTVRRDALLETLPAEQRAVAEQLAIGGIPAVRRAIAEQQTQDREAGRTVVGGDAIITLAEQLLPSVREAVWIDRAEAALERLEVISLRDLRATVTGAATRSEGAKELLSKLRSALEERLTKLRTKWEQEISHALEEGRVLQALRLSAKPPEPSTRFPASLVEPLATAAGSSLSDTAQPERWIALLEAAANSPVRRSIKPTGIPADPTHTVRQAASAAAGRVPALAKLLGLAIPPPPRPMNAQRSTHPTEVTSASTADTASPTSSAAPESAAPESAAPESAAPESAAPESAAPESAAPESAAPESAAPESAAPESAAPESAVPVGPADVPATQEALPIAPSVELADLGHDDVATEEAPA